MSASQKLIDKRIQEYKANPILPLELAEINQLFVEPSASVEQFKHYYQRCPLFCFELVSLAWQATQSKNIHPLAADHALSLIGIDMAKHHFKKIQSAPNNQLSDEVQFLLTSSLLAAELANKLTNKPSLYWAALFHQLPDIFLWHLDPKSMWRIQYHTSKKFKKINLFEEAKLGFNLSEWRINVAEQFQMNEHNLLTYQKPRPNDVRELLSYMNNGISEKTPIIKQWHGSDSWTILLCNWLAKALLLPQFANACRHYRLITQQTFGLNNRKLAHIIAECLNLTSQHLFGSNLLTPAVNALLLRSNSLYPQWLTSPEVNLNRGMAFNKFQEKSQSNMVKKSYSNTNTFDKNETELNSENAQLKQPTKNDNKKNNNSILINQLLQQPEKFETSVKMISQVMSSIIEDLNFDRATLLSVEFKGEYATSKIALAQNGLNKIRPDFSFKMNAAKVASPLRKFILQQGGLLFSKDKHQKIWSKLPLAIQKENVEAFFFYSIKPASQVKILIYVDAIELSQFQSDNILRLKLLLNALNSALVAREASKQKTS